MNYAGIENVSFLQIQICLNVADLDSAIMDPTNQDLYASILATEVLLNKDPYCRKYNRAYRAGKIGPVKAN